jgi:hypothetical protein
LGKRCVLSHIQITTACRDHLLFLTVYVIGSDAYPDPRVGWGCAEDGVHPMTEKLAALLKEARSVPMTKADREAQRRSFVYGNTAFENSRITRELVDRIAEQIEETSRPNGA